MPGAARARATTGIRLSASSVPKKPATATGSHGPWASAWWYQPLTRDHRAGGQPAAEARRQRPRRAARRAVAAQAGALRAAVQHDAGRSRDCGDPGDDDRPYVGRRVVHDILHEEMGSSKEMGTSLETSSPALRGTVRTRATVGRHPKVPAGWNIAALRSVTRKCYRAGYRPVAGWRPGRPSASRYTDRTQRLERGSLVALSGRSPMADQPVVATAGAAMSRQDVLLATKLHVPRRRPGFVPRPRLAGGWKRG